MQDAFFQESGENLLPNTIQEDTGRTPLHEAAIVGDEKSIEVLLAAGADRNAKDLIHGNTALHEAAWRGYSRCVKLLSASQQPKSIKNLKESKLKGIIKENRGVLQNVLLSNRNNGGFSALHLAAQNGHNQSCRELLLAGADPDVQNNYGDTPLHTACRYGHAGATRILISAKCDPNRTNLNGDTPLHISCAMGRRKLTKILLEAGSNIEIKNAQNETSKEIAVRKKLTQIIEIINNFLLSRITKEQEKNNKKSTTNNGIKIDEIDGGAPKKLDIVVNPANWSPYGCHYFPDPRSFPSPKLETLPKEPLGKGEQYYLDLAGNIHKGPIGVGSTCYCGPFFKHIEQKMNKNRKSLRRYVHKATERLDNKVQKLALKTDNKIERLTRSMIADRMKCEENSLHLQQWLKRGEPSRATIGHFLKTKKNQDNTNTLTRCRSLEMIDDANLVEDKRVQNSKSFDGLDENVTDYQRNNNHHVHHRYGIEIIPHFCGERDKNSLSSKHHFDRSTSKNSTQSQPSDSRSDCERYSVSKRLEKLLEKTNEILKLEKKSHREKIHSSNFDFENYASCPNNNKDAMQRLKILEKNKKHRHSMLPINDNQQHIECITSAGNRKRNDLENTECIEMEMNKIAASLQIDDKEYHRLPPLSPEISKECESRKEYERKSDHEHEKSSILSSGSQKNPSSRSSFYVSEINDYNNKHKNAHGSNSSANENSRYQKVTIVRKDYEDFQKTNSCVDECCTNLRKKFSQVNFSDDNSRNTTNYFELQKPFLDGNAKQEQFLNSMGIIDDQIFLGLNYEDEKPNKNMSNYNDMQKVNGTITKFEIKNSEIKTLKNSNKLSRRNKVWELVAKIQGKEPKKSVTPYTDDSAEIREIHETLRENHEISESSEDEGEHEIDGSKKMIRTNSKILEIDHTTQLNQISSNEKIFTCNRVKIQSQETNLQSKCKKDAKEFIPMPLEDNIIRSSGSLSETIRMRNPLPLLQENEIIQNIDAYDNNRIMLGQLDLTIHKSPLNQEVLRNSNKFENENQELIQSSSYVLYDRKQNPSSSSQSEILLNYANSVALPIDIEENYGNNNMKFQRTKQQHAQILSTTTDNNSNYYENITPSSLV